MLRVSNARSARASLACRSAEARKTKKHIPGSFWPEGSKMSSSCQKSGAHPDGQQHGVSTQISINLGKTFLRISRIRNIPLTWILARVFVYVPPFISQILDFIYWTVLIFILIYFERRDTENLLVARVALGFESCGDCCIQQIQSSLYSVVSGFFNGTSKISGSGSMLTKPVPADQRGREPKELNTSDNFRNVRLLF